MPASLVAPELVWGLIPRFIGLLYVIAFGGLISQLYDGLGSKGLLPIAPRLAAARRDLSPWRRFHQLPTVLWLNSSDRFIRTLPFVGVALGLCIMYGGPIAPVANVLAWMLWLSLEPAGLIFPWDTMLQEAGFLCLFLPGTEPLPALTASALPWPSVAFLFRFFLLRLMLGFGKVKFVGAKSSDSLYLRGFFVWMPSPTPVAWFGHHLPSWMLRSMLYFMFVAEVIAPLLGFFSGPPRLIGYGLLVSLMVGIHLSGNWGYFNIGYALLLTCLLDTQSSIFDLGNEPWASMLHQPSAIALHVVLGFMFLIGLVYLVALDSWSMRTVLHWPFDMFTWNRAWLRTLINGLRFLAPFRIINGYGVFPPQAGAPVRSVPVFEGSDDGVTWKAYRYRHMATSAHERSRFVAPYQPRVDMALCYSAGCIYDGSFFGSLIGDGTPYACYARSTWLDRMAQRLLEGDPRLLRKLAHNPFPEAPPKQVRVSVVAMTATSPAVRKATGAWWHTRHVGVFVQPTGKADWPDQLGIPEPEVSHPDWLEFRRRAKPLRAIGAAFLGGAEPDAAVRVSSDFSAEEVAHFWDELVPALQTRRGDYSDYVERSEALVQRYGRLQLARFERIMERFTWLLRLRTERHHYEKLEPKIPIESVFRYHMFLQEMVLDGRAAYQAVLADPSLAAARHQSSSDGAQLWALAMFRRDLMLQHVCAFRWMDMGIDCYNLKLPGIFEYYPVLAAIVPPGEEFRCVTTKLPNGEHTIEGLYPPPALA
jgi:hypothetical protein